MLTQTFAKLFICFFWGSPRWAASTCYSVFFVIISWKKYIKNLNNSTINTLRYLPEEKSITICSQSLQAKRSLMTYQKLPWVLETFHARSSLYSDPRERSATALMAPSQLQARSNRFGPDFGHYGWLAPYDHLRDFECNRRYNWLTRKGHQMKEYFKLCCLC